MKNLSAANKLMIKIAETNKHVTPVTPDDLPLFQKFFQKEPHTYGNSWTYVTQGAYGIGPNNLGYKYYDGRNLCLIAIYPKIEEPNKLIFYWVHPMGTKILDIILDISKRVMNDYSLTTYVKKIFINQSKYLLKKGFFEISKYPWHNESPAEDDTFPELIFNIKNTLQKIDTFPKTNTIRRTLQAMEKLKSKHKIEITEQNFENEAWKVVKAFFKTEKNKGNKINFSSEYDYYNMIFSNPSRPTLIRKLIKSHGTSVGFYIGEKHNKDYCSYYALITLRRKLRFLSDFILLTILKEGDTRYFNSGGSEDKGIHGFKLKYLPEKQQNMRWVTNFHG